PVANSEVRDIRSDLPDDARRQLARRKRTLREELVLASDHQKVDEIHADGVNVDHDLVVLWRRLGNILAPEALRRPELSKYDSAHDKTLLRCHGAPTDGNGGQCPLLHLCRQASLENLAARRQGNVF